MRYSTLGQIKEHPFFGGVEWDSLRAVRAPFVPALDSDIDTGYYDDFTSAEEMAKYAEVQEKQRHVDAVREKDDAVSRGVWVGFTFEKNGPAVKAFQAATGEEDALATIF